MRDHQIGCLLFGLSAVAVLAGYAFAYTGLTSNFGLTRFAAVSILGFGTLAALFIIATVFAFATQGDDPKWSHR